ncbi:hypothetical protein HPB47_018679 [Ixodes persulcatus]|uniref:Uncharacterized protein n=1 Tax=Ixodes persulcatus TaxID=34615 RepID=A0AC60QNM4_IXOPE|nr:hypothetical protein HPB47_018679 [Ixodes persulcatus]
MEYKILLPPLPDGKLLENSLILHGDPSARPYRIDDFGPALKKIINPNELASLGAYQYNHVWLLTSISWCTLKFLRLPDKRTLTDLTKIIMVLGLHALWWSRVDMTEFTLTPKPAWRHFANKLDCTI